MMIYKVIKPEPKTEKIIIRLPSSKSISNRLLIMSALSGNKLKVNGVSDSDDTTAMIKNLVSTDRVRDIGHAGTAMRFLTSFFALVPGEVVLTGSERMKNRPVGELVDNLRKLGADITYTGVENYPPLHIKGGNLRGGSITVYSGISSQFISSLLMIAPLLPGGLMVTLKGNLISASYIDMTLRLMGMAGIEYTWDGDLISVREGSYREGTMTVEPDWSAASYWYEIAALSENADILLEGLTRESLQGDSALAQIFLNLGISTFFTKTGAHLKKTGSLSEFFDFDFKLNPDLVQTVVPVCVLLGVPFRFAGTQTLRIKETDRISALQDEMEKFGVMINSSEKGDWIAWDGKTEFRPSMDVLIKTYDDHRMAMAFAPVALKAGEVKIDDPLVVTKSYPSFWSDLKLAGFKIAEIR